MNLIPQPKQCTVREGQFHLTPQTVIAAGPQAAGVAGYLARKLFPATGWNLPVRATRAKGHPYIFLALDSRLSGLGAEGYKMEVTPVGVTIRAHAPAGLFYACQTLLQLLPAAIFREAPVEGMDWAVPCVEIVDQPRFAWRGAHLDSCRHFMPKEFIKKLLDLLALHKMNSFHWHLTDDQGWRVEIKKYPRLTEVGAWRKQTLVGHDYAQPDEETTYDGLRHGGFYTQDDIREIVAYAQERFINVVPEIEMPGHAQAAIAAYPELGNLSEPVEVCQRFGVITHVFNVNESTILFLQDVLSEVLELFPGKFIHVGGDECPKQEWRESPAAQARKQELGLKDEHELQSYFIRRMDDFLTARGRRLIGWDEILEGGLAPNATVMSWRGEKGGIQAANAGHDVVMAPTTYTYLDYYPTEQTEGEPLGIGGYLPPERVYGYEPLAKGFSREARKHVLGIQGQLWTEYIPTPKQAEYMYFPRLTALAEVGWTAAKHKDYASFLARLEAFFERLDVLDVNYRPV
ncbi:MAG: beta-N-acetylhexosaminidase [Anaerolineaceae bacterium]|nr:beta-N-acetylhexosaminidase [Anaerolineaceae bacterium]